ncbi:long-chain-fatty-acid--CoA ligase [Chelatococcus reniformis]|uniref:Fatty-acid--CoA ligase n=1 Tax=Chelatococcus reniformis TaxID=1494448 RepID=A0A916UE94_9HYPH|nr:long-chain-fatty-acid--CoA ligase [Chelatococcus reniformis]GGC70211.1 fatty-acid--CoA ligase [Chelatococcus reniformis]
MPDTPVSARGGDALRLSQALERAARLRGREEAVVDGERRFTWAEFKARVERLAGALRGLGLEPGGRVAMLAHNSHRYLEFYFGVPWAGGVFTPLNTRLAVPELAAILRDCGAEILIVDEAHAPLVPELARLAPLRRLVLGADGPVPDGFVGYEAMLAAAVPLADAGRGGDDIAALFYTSGSTGAPKGVMHTHANIMYCAVMCAAAVKLDEEATSLICGPLFHVGAAGACIPAMVTAARVVLLPRFEPAEVLRAIDEHRVTAMNLVPTMLRMMLDHPTAGERDLSSLRMLAYGAAPMPEPLLNEALQLMPDAQFVHAYGMTELTASCTALPPRYITSHRHLGKAKSVGRALLGLDLAIVDPEDNILGPGETGEIVARGPTVMKGYWGRPDLTAQTLRNGWLHTGDLGYMDEDGFVFLVDRLKDMIITGGENVYSTEVEEALYALPGVAQCAVIGIPHPKWGESVHAIVVAGPGAELTEAAIMAHCRGRIAGYKCPRSIEIRDTALPLSGANKIDKPALRTPFWAGRGSRLV